MNPLFAGFGGEEPVIAGTLDRFHSQRHAPAARTDAPAVPDRAASLPQPVAA